MKSFINKLRGGKPSPDLVLVQRGDASLFEVADESSDGQIVENEFEIVQILDRSFQNANFRRRNASLAEENLVEVALELEVVHGMRHAVPVQHLPCRDEKKDRNTAQTF